MPIMKQSFGLFSTMKCLHEEQFRSEGAFKFFLSILACYTSLTYINSPNFGLIM